MRQTWANIVWCHWPVEPAAVAAVLPDGLTPDLHEGKAWVGLIPFAMEDLRLANCLRFVTRWLRSAYFGEVNVRTYVIGPDGQRGVWFCTLDADSVLGVATANVALGLPYRVATTKFSGDSHRWDWYSRRRDGAVAALDVRITDEPARAAHAGLETFLLERYALYSVWHGRILRGELHHEPWRVRTATLQNVTTETVEAAGFTVLATPHVLVGDPVEVSVFRPSVVGGR